MPADPTSPAGSESANPKVKTGSGDPEPESPPRGSEPSRDPGLRRLLKWVVGALILTVLFAILVVEITLRWFGP